MSNMPERALWIAVLHRAVEDVFGIGTQRGGPDAKGADLDRDRALQWVLRGGPDFRDVCEMAGFEARTVRRVILSGWAARRETASFALQDIFALLKGGEQHGEGDNESQAETA